MLSNLKSNHSHQQLSLCFIRKMSALSLLFACSKLVMFCTLTCGCGRRWLLPPPYLPGPELQSLQQWRPRSGIRMLPTFPSFEHVFAGAAGAFRHTAPSKAGWPAHGVGVPRAPLGRPGSPGVWHRMAPWPGVPLSRIQGGLLLLSCSS